MIAVMDRDEITAEVAARLVAGQFPQWAGLPVVPVGLNGWDNITFRLGGEPPGPGPAAGRCGKHSSPSAAPGTAMTARKQPAGSAGATARARSSAGSSPTTT